MRAMSTTTNTPDLCTRIEALVQEHIAASREAAMAALQRAFSSDASSSPPRSHRRRTQSPATYRSRETLVALQEAIYERLKANPGVGAAELSAQLSITVKEMSGPMTKLKKAGLARSIGQRTATRYFPVLESAATPS
jgi:predicted HTH transcriptional regulator